MQEKRVRVLELLQNFKFALDCIVGRVVCRAEPPTLERLLVHLFNGIPLGRILKFAQFYFSKASLAELFHRVVLVDPALLLCADETGN